MAIKEEEQKKNGMTIIDNMGGEKSALEKLNMKKADISDKMNTSQIKEYIRRAKSGQDVNDYLKQFDLKNQLVFCSHLVVIQICQIYHLV